MAYNPSDIFSSASYDQYGRSRGSSKKNTTNKAGPRGFSRKSSSSSFASGSTYDEVPQTITTGLGTPQFPKDPSDSDDDMNPVTKIAKTFVDSMIRFVPDFGPDEGPEVTAIKVYERPEFYIPESPEVTVSSIQDSLDPLNVMRKVDDMLSTAGTNKYTPETKGTGSYDEVKAQNVKEATDEEKSAAMKDEINKTISSIMMPPTANYKIKDGDTLSEIAQASGTTVAKLKEINKIDDIDIIEAGSELKIPVQSALDIEIVENADKMSDLNPMKAKSQSTIPMDQREFAPEDTTGFAGMGPDPSVGQGIMSPQIELGENVDFDFIAEQEGEAINNAYVPQDDDGNPEGQSGVTVGTGVDLGSKDSEYFDGLDEDLVEKLEPYFGQTRENAQNILAISPLSLTDAEVSELDQFVKDKELATLRNRWNRDSDTEWDDLPENQATAVASVFYQYGPQMFGHNYWDQTTSGDWTAARNNLMDYGDNYRSRRRREARYLESGEM